MQTVDVPGGGWESQAEGAGVERLGGEGGGNA